MNILAENMVVMSPLQSNQTAESSSVETCFSCVGFFCFLYLSAWPPRASIVLALD